MRGSMIRHKSRLCRIVHRYYCKPGSTMPMHPLLWFTKQYPKNRAELATLLRSIRPTVRRDFPST
jgi:hypothetical protein